jgi:hypothetical protein
VRPWLQFLKRVQTAADAPHVDIGLPLPSRRAFVLGRVLSWRLALCALAVGSAGVRTWAAWRRATPNYFPDEYIYSSLSRSLARGQLPSVRGHVAHFPALLQPLLTAPAWWFGSLETGYRAVQAIDSVAMATVAFAVWWAARRLGVGAGAAFGAAALAVAVPDMGYSSFVLSEPFAYPLFVAAIAAGAVALATPSRRAQCTFIGFALLACFARMQLVVVPLAYVLAALALRRARAQTWVLSVFGGAALVALVAGLGYYARAPSSFHVVAPSAIGRNALVLAYASGWLVVPAAVLGLVAAVARPRSDEERAFGVLALTSAVAVFGEAVLYGTASDAHERYGCYLLPLLALGFALHASRRWPWKRAHALMLVLMLVVASAVPMSGWAAAGHNAHSLVLTALLKVEAVAGGAGSGGLDVVQAVAVLTVVGVICAWRRATAVAAAAAIAFCIAASAFAVSFDTQNSRNVKATFDPAGAGWVHGPATVILGAASRTSVLEQLFWSRYDDRLALLPGAARPDVFAAAATHLTRDGRLAGVRGRVVLDELAAALVPVAPERRSGPWLAARTPVLAGTVAGRYGNGWIAPSGTIRVYRPGSIRLTVTAPEAMTVKIAGGQLRLRAHVPARLCAGATTRYSFSSHGYLGMTPVSAQTSFPRWSPRGCS